VRTTEQEVAERIAREDGPPQPATSRPKRAPSAQLALLQQELKHALGTNVDIRQTARGSGRIILHFSNNREFERLHQLLGGQPQSRKAA
jgi:ParB family chromosome partitioning protein